MQCCTFILRPVGFYLDLLKRFSLLSQFDTMILKHILYSRLLFSKIVLVFFSLTFIDIKYLGFKKKIHIFQRNIVSFLQNIDFYFFTFFDLTFLYFFSNIFLFNILLFFMKRKLTISISS